jgi:hypothetical protein
LALVAAPLAFAAACSSSETNPSSSAGGDPGAPAAPTRLSAAQMGTGIHVTWKDNSSDEAEFELERKEGSGAFAKVASVVFDTVQFHDTSVTAGKSYTYRGRAVGSSGLKSAYTNEATMEAPKEATGPKDSGVDAPVPSWDGGAVSFSQHIVPLFERSCGLGGTGCHEKEQHYATSAKGCRGWLTLENASLGSKGYGGAVDGQPTNCPDRSLYDRLVQLDAWQEPAGQLMKYVTPGDLAKSYLYNKAAGGPVGEKSPGVASEPMPPTGPLGATDLAMLKKWIETGAPK